ncbi:unnamed protein product [Chrysoparadoxa australica]
MESPTMTGHESRVHPLRPLSPSPTSPSPTALHPMRLIPEAVRHHADTEHHDHAAEGWESRITLGVIIATLIMSWNAIAMFVAEVIIEILVLVGAMPKIPFRMDFFSLTTLSALLAYQTLRGIHHGEMEVTRNALIVAVAVESFLLIGDFLFLNEYADKYFAVIPVRTPFMALTFVNVLLVVFIYFKLHLWESKADEDEEASQAESHPLTDMVSQGSSHGRRRETVLGVLFENPQTTLDMLQHRTSHGRLQRSSTLETLPRRPGMLRRSLSLMEEGSGTIEEEGMGDKRLPVALESAANDGKEAPESDTEPDTTPSPPLG